ncbi:MAG TPA: hypothetical protein VNE63_09205 [Candidatus Acidoferrales bacterium]|nr:hypothetical protein [Candidatus Acidoferrales bacterium]
MPSGLILRSYPVTGVEIVPVKFRAGIYGIFVMELFPVAAAVWFGTALRNVSPPRPPWMLYALAVSLLTVLIAAMYLYKLTAEITSDGISYGTFSHRQKFVPFQDISAAVLIDYKHLGSEATPRRSLRRWTLLITPKVESGMAALKVPLTFFPASACDEFIRVLRPDQWESGT